MICVIGQNSAGSKECPPGAREAPAKYDVVSDALVLDVYCDGSFLQWSGGTSGGWAGRVVNQAQGTSRLFLDPYQPPFRPLA